MRADRTFLRKEAGVFMTKVIVTGHAGYASFIKNSMAAIMGSSDDFFFVDFNADDNLDTLEQKLTAAIAQCGDEILFSCDLQGGSPFNLVAVKSAENEKYFTVAGINISAYAEVVNNLDLPAKELAQLAIDVTRLTVVMFPEE
jgi:PTS system N-acetylgalactosamine-specific IIA component